MSMPAAPNLPHRPLHAPLGRRYARNAARHLPEPIVRPIPRPTLSVLPVLFVSPTKAVLACQRRPPAVSSVYRSRWSLVSYLVDSCWAVDQRGFVAAAVLAGRRGPSMRQESSGAELMVGRRTLAMGTKARDAMQGSARRPLVVMLKVSAIGVRRRSGVRYTATRVGKVRRGGGVEERCCANGSCW
jgi:hypothetical protein